MSNISKCENCGCEKIEIVNKYKGHYACPKCGRDTERLYELEHDEEIRNKAIDEFSKKATEWNNKSTKKVPYEFIKWIAEQMKGSEENEID